MVFFAAAFAQRPSIKTAGGYLFIQNGKDVSFVCEIKGKDIKPLTTGENPAFDTDGMIIQLVWVPSGNYEPTGKVELAKLLETHQKWEVDYLSTVIGTPVKVEAEDAELGGRALRSWSILRSKYADEYDRDSFLTTLVGRNIFGLSSPVKKGTDLAETRRRLFEAMATLRVKDKPFDVLKLAEAIKAGKDPFK